MSIPRRTLRRLAILGIAIVSCLTISCTAAESACDRACLIDIADGYLAAVAAHDPAKAPLSDDVAFVENVTALMPGEGLWASAAGEATHFRIYVPDEAESSIGVMTVIDRRTALGVVPAQLALRLKIQEGRVVEAEHLVADVASEEGLARLEAPRTSLTTVVPERERSLRPELAAIAASYYDALVASDGTLAPFADDCERPSSRSRAAKSTKWKRSASSCLTTHRAGGNRPRRSPTAPTRTRVALALVLAGV